MDAEAIKPYFDQVVDEAQAQEVVQSRGEFVKYEGSGSVWKLPHDVWARVDPSWGRFRVRLYRTKECPC